MLEPVALNQFFIAVMAGALVVLSGALYAGAFALARLRDSRPWLILAYVFYAVLAVMVALLARALNLGGFWLTLVATLLLGYLVAPQLIWRLCVGTHRHDDHPDPDPRPDDGAAVQTAGESP